MEYYHTNDYPIEIVKTYDINKNYELHNHTSHYVISLVTQGAVTAYMQGNKKSYMQGETFCVIPFEPHAVYLKKSACLLSVCIGKELLENHALYEVRDVLQDTLQKAVNNSILDSAESEYIMGALNNLYRLRSYKMIIMESNMHKLTNCIINHPEEDMPLSQMSEEYCFSKYYLIRKFRKHVGMAPHQFHIQSRIRKAQVLLRKGYTIVEVSLQMGFYDQSHFDKYFHRIVGISPSEYIVSVNSLG